MNLFIKKNKNTLPYFYYVKSLLVIAVSVMLISCRQGAKSISNQTDYPFLYPYQWHLHNEGQKVFAKENPTPGVDLNMSDLYEQGVRGTGVIVMVQDTAIDHSHKDLIRNLIPVQGVKPATNPHGTAIAGIIAAHSQDGSGVRGVAPEAKLWDINYPIVDKALKPDIANQSNGAGGSAYISLQLLGIDLEKEIQGSLIKRMNGKNMLTIKAAGNDYFNDGSNDRNNIPGFCDKAKRYQLSCYSANTDPLNWLPFSVVVAAVNAKGTRSSDSSSGSSIWISGLGGEDGEHEPAILTTDISGCDVGLNKKGSKKWNDIDAGGQSKLDPMCYYTARANGTSSATPTVTGVVALMLQVNPSLDAWGIKHILARTARKINPYQKSNIDKGLMLENGWITNAAGHAYSNWYGFGLVDASAAVKMAATFHSLSRQIDSGWIPYGKEAVEIPVRDDTRGAAKIHVSNKLTIDTVFLTLRTTHTEPAMLRGILTSPNGTKSFVLVPHAELYSLNKGQGFVVPLTVTNAFLDETSYGDWYFQLVDVADTSPAKNAYLLDWGIRILGR